MHFRFLCVLFVSLLSYLFSFNAAFAKFEIKSYPYRVSDWALFQENERLTQDEINAITKVKTEAILDISSWSTIRAKLEAFCRNEAFDGLAGFSNWQFSCSKGQFDQPLETEVFNVHEMNKAIDDVSVTADNEGFRRDKTKELYSKIGTAIQNKCPRGFRTFYHGMSYENSILTEVLTAIGKAKGLIDRDASDKTLLRMPNQSQTLKKSTDIWDMDNYARNHEGCVNWVRAIIQNLQPNKVNREERWKSINQSSMKVDLGESKKAGDKDTGNESLRESWITDSQKEGWNEVHLVTKFVECNNTSSSDTAQYQKCQSEFQQYLAAVKKMYTSSSVSLVLRIMRQTVSENTGSTKNSDCDEKTVFWDNRKTAQIVSADVYPKAIGRNESALYFLINNKGAQNLSLKAIIRGIITQNGRPFASEEEFNTFYTNSLAPLEKQLSDLSKSEKIGLMHLVCIPEDIKPAPYYISSAYGIPLTYSDLKHVERRTAEPVDGGISNAFRHIAKGKYLVEPSKYLGYKDHTSVRHLYPQIRLLPEYFDMKRVNVITISSSTDYENLDKQRENLLNSLKEHFEGK